MQPLGLFKSPPRALVQSFFSLSSVLSCFPLCVPQGCGLPLELVCDDLRIGCVVWGEWNVLCEVVWGKKARVGRHECFGALLMLHSAMNDSLYTLSLFGINPCSLVVAFFWKLLFFFPLSSPLVVVDNGRDDDTKHI